ncbi:hypothetical protein ACP6IB_05980 [Vibrio harveyi]|uniref:hypothetical protein n=1 Tax=Vibrio harveyi TaxID=669 RepID=UPI00028E4524|nr:hypothetical protein [Vibrio harveyi]EKM14488.1 hypothetical protein VCHENC01_0965 [Vibrio harveyi]
MNNFLKVTIVFFVYFGSTANASIKINSMIAFAENNTTEFTITNDDDYRQFINVQIREIKISEQGKLVKIPYTRENIDVWSVSSTPARGIVEPNAMKVFRVKYEPLSSHDDNRDKIYQVSFIPTPYLGEGESLNNSVQIAVGFSPFFIVPSKTDQALSYEVRHNGKAITIHNSGKSYIRAAFEGCENDLLKREADACKKTAYILSGRQVDISLPESMQKGLTVKLSTHNFKYEHEFEIDAGKVDKSSSNSIRKG